MRRSPLFRKPPARIILLIILAITAIPFAHASTYVGYGSSNQGPATCGANCEATGNVNFGIGETVQAPFAGQLVAVGIFTGSGTPNQVVILTFPAGSTPSSTAYGCGGAGTCASINNGQSFTVQDVESVVGLGASAFSTISLAGPVTVANGQWVAIVFMCTNCAASNIIMAVGASGQTTTLDTGFNFATTNPSVGSAFSTGGQESLAGIVGGSFNAQGTSGGTVTVTQCYGNCGSPAITLVNTNSTHSINFNQTVTLLYQFQSNVNGFLLNVTASLAKSYAVLPNGPAFAVYTIPNCPIGQTPFSASCPGLLQVQSAGQNFFSPPKGRISLAGLNVPVTNGQWVGIALSAFQSGLDVNDTNTGVPIFQTNEGKNPPAIQGAALLNSNSKVGLWAWIRGNVITGNPPTTPGSSCQSFATIDCWLPALVNGFCSNSSPQCQTSSALFWILVLSVLFEVALAYCFNTAVPNLKIPFGEMFILIILIWTFILTGLSLIFVWVPVFFFMIGSILFSRHTGRYF